MSESNHSRFSGIPVLLLKTKSTPFDAYEQYFSPDTPAHRWEFEPTFVPVLHHRFEESGLARVRALLDDGQVSSADGKYGGLIFTSQRAVEAFATIVEEEKERGQENASPDLTRIWSHLQTIPIYTVGPATTRALQALPQHPPLTIFGSGTGNGESLANYILDHYGEWYKDRSTKPPLLFVVGQQRRDVIPKTLMDPGLPADKRIAVGEVVVYGTGVMESFEKDFGKLLQETSSKTARWVVVFSPTGCEAMLRALGMLDGEREKQTLGEKGEKTRRTYIATIGPTTRDYLRQTFGFEPDVCAAQPSPEGVCEGIVRFMQNNLGDMVE